MAVIDHDGLAVSTHALAEGHTSIRRSDDLSAVTTANIHATVECAFTVEWIDPLAKAAGDLAFDGPQVGGGVRLEPICRSGIAGQAHGQANHCRSTQGRGAQGVQLVERRTYISVMNLVRGRCHQRRLSLQTVQGRNLSGDRSQGGHLHVALFGNLLQTGVVVFELIFFRPQLVVAGNLQQHTSVGAGNSGQAEESDCGPHDE